jgi:signal transduction histidine kinase
MKKYARIAALTVPVSTDEDGRRLEHMLNVILVAGIVCLGILDIVLSDKAVITTFLVICSTLFTTSKSGYSRLAAYILIILSTIIAIYSGWVFGASLPTTLLIFAFISAMSGIIIRSRAGIVVSGILVLILTILGIHEVYILGLTTWKYDMVHPTDIVIYATIILFIAVISWLSNRELEKSLYRARQSEKELEYERDLLEIKVAERTLELKKSQAERLAELSRIAEFGTLARGLFHDLMTPLTSVALHVEKLEKIETVEKAKSTAHDIEETRAYIKKAITASNKMAVFMDNIRRHVQRDGQHDRLYDGDGNADGNERSCDIKSEAKFVVDLLAYKAREAAVVVTVESSIEQGYRYYANPFYFHQIFQNLIVNAIEACAGMKEKIIRVEISEKKIIISDNGPGIAAKNLSKIFEPFFTTKQSPHNTGIGLHTIKSIVEEKLKGKITVESTEGADTTFIIDLP